MPRVASLRGFKAMRLNVLMNDQRNLARGAAVLLIGGLAAGCSSNVARFNGVDNVFTATTNQRQIIAPASQPYPGGASQWRLWPARGQCRALGFAAGRWRQPSGIDGAGRGPLGRAAGRRPENGSAGVACDGQAGKRRARPADLGGGDVHRRPDHGSSPAIPSTDCRGASTCPWAPCWRPTACRKTSV